MLDVTELRCQSLRLGKGIAMSAWTVVKIPEHMAGCAETENPLYLDRGKWTVVDGVFVKPSPGEIVAHEVIAAGTASVTVRGPVRVIAFEHARIRAERASFVAAADQSRVTVLRGGEAHMIGDKSRATARAGSEVHLKWGSRAAVRASRKALVVDANDEVPRLRVAA